MMITDNIAALVDTPGQGLLTAVKSATTMCEYIDLATRFMLGQRQELQRQLADLDAHMQDQPDFTNFALVDVAIFDIMSAMQAASERLLEAKAHLERVPTLASAAADVYYHKPDEGTPE